MEENIGWGWKIYWSSNNQKYYYYNSIDRVSFWTLEDVLIYIGH